MCEWLYNGEWCDVKLLCGGKTFNAHRAVLASVSVFLRQLLLSCETDELPTFIVLPDFDLEAMSSVLYYIYNGEVVVQKQKLPRFLDIIKAMRIFIDHRYIALSSCEIEQNTNLELNGLNSTSNVPRSDIFTLGLGEREDQKVYNIKKDTKIKDLMHYSLNHSDHNDKRIRIQNQSEWSKASLGNLKSQYGDRQRNSFLRDLYIETYPRNGNVNGQMAGVLAISNERYRTPTSVLSTNANGEHLNASDTVLEANKNTIGVPFNFPSFAQPMKSLYEHDFKQNYYENSLKTLPSQSQLKVCCNEITEMKLFYKKCASKGYVSGWDDKESGQKMVSLLPVPLNGQTVSENRGSYLDLSLRDRMTADIISSLNTRNHIPANDSLHNKTNSEKQPCTTGINISSKMMIHNHVLNSPWTTRFPINFKPFRRKIQEIDKGNPIQQANKESAVSDSNNNIEKSIPEQLPLSDENKPITLCPEPFTKNSYKCSTCYQIFTSNEALSLHMHRHLTTSRYSCSECGKTFSQLRNFKYHMSIHRGTREFAATCTVCGKYFNDRGYLSSHMKIHRNRKEYKCSICPKSFNQRVAYNMHMRIHTGVKPHVCDECGKAFSRKMLLKQHQRTHSGERPYACPHCDKRFADRSNMTLHLRLHTGVKPFSCSLCPKSFTKKHHLKSHLNFHTGSKPYSCPRCKLAFTQSSNMRTHMKKCNVPLSTQTASSSNT